MLALTMLMLNSFLKERSPSRGKAADASPHFQPWRYSMGHKLLSALALTGGVLALAVTASAAASPTVIPAGDFKWVAAPAPYPSGWMLSILSGDPKAAGSMYVIRLKVPDGGKIPVHEHGKTETVTVISGTFLVAIGSKFDESKLKPLEPGSFASIPPGVPHYAQAKGETVVQVSGIGPEETKMIK
jgi:quercetin dioxygenase-like cupin family protein